MPQCRLVSSLLRQAARAVVLRLIGVREAVRALVPLSIVVLERANLIHAEAAPISAVVAQGGRAIPRVATSRTERSRRLAGTRPDRARVPRLPRPFRGRRRRNRALAPAKRELAKNLPVHLR